jgi:hypothetical protein
MVSGFVSRRGSLLGLLVGAAAIPLAAPSRGASASGCGLVVLTVGGLVGAPNRSPLDGKRDRFFQHNNLDFKQARAYTFADLQALPQQSAPVVEEGGVILFRGPRLHDVLAAAKPTSKAKTARLSALDGYAAEIPLATIAQDGWVLAVEAGGNAFGIGDVGPLYTVRPLAAGKKRTDEEDAKWVFSLYYIELMP